MLGTAKILMSFAATTGLLMQTGADGGCVNLGLFPGFAGLATPGIGLATGVNPAPGNFNDIIEPPDNGQLPDNPLDDFMGDPLANLMGTTLNLRNVDQFDMEVQFLIDGFLRIFVVRAGETLIEVLEEENCVESIDLLTITVREQFTGLFVDNVDFLLDTTADWPGPLGPLRCGDTVQYSFDVIDISQGIRLPDIIFFGNRVTMDVQTSRIGVSTTGPQN